MGADNQIELLAKNHSSPTPNLTVQEVLKLFCGKKGL